MLVAGVAFALLGLPEVASAARDLTISDAPTTGVTRTANGPTQVTYVPSSLGANLAVADLEADLATANVTVSTNVLQGTAAGTLRVNDEVAWAADTRLGLDASGGSGGVVIADPVSGTGTSSGVTIQGQSISQDLGAAVSATGPTSLYASNGPITMHFAANDFDQPVSVLCREITLFDKDGLVLGGVSAQTRLALDVDGPITQTQPVVVGNTTEIWTGNSDVVLTDPENQLGTDLRVRETDDVTIADRDHIAVVADLTGDLVASSGGEISGIFEIDGTTTLDAEGVVRGDSIDNDFGGSVAVTSASGSVKLNDRNDLALGPVAAPGPLEVRAAGSLTQVGAATAASLDAAAGSISLPNPANDFFAARLNANAGPAHIHDRDSLDLEASSALGRLEAVAGRDLTVSGPLSGTPLTLVADAGTADGVGSGGLRIDPGVALASASPISLYSGARDHNFIGAGAAFNGAAFTPGAEFTDTEREVWGTPYPAGTASGPFTFFYEEAAPQPDTTLRKTPKKRVKAKGARARVAFEFDSTVSGSTFHCTLDGNTKECDSPFRARVRPGKHRFSVVATAAGRTDPTPATYSFKVKRPERARP